MLLKRLLSRHVKIFVANYVRKRRYFECEVLSTFFFAKDINETIVLYFSIIIIHFHILQINYWIFNFCVIIIMIDRDLRCERSRVFRRFSRLLFNSDLTSFDWIEFTFFFFLCLKCSKHILDLQFDCKHDNSASTRYRDCVRRHESCFSMKEFSY
jgi:hypothetical protein